VLKSPAFCNTLAVPSDSIRLQVAQPRKLSGISTVESHGRWAQDLATFK